MSSLTCTNAADRSHPRPRDRRPTGVLAALLLALTGGCADWSYDRIQIGMTSQECARSLPEEAVRRTELGFCCLAQDRHGRTDALVVLISRDGRVAGKLQATLPTPNTWSPVQTDFRLRGEIDPTLTDLQAVGPIDMLRAIIGDLTGYRGVQTAQQAHAWVAAGLVRLLERWPHIGPGSELYPQLTDTLERLPGGGTARIEVDQRGVYCLEYRQPTGP